MHNILVALENDQLHRIDALLEERRAKKAVKEQSGERLTKSFKLSDSQREQLTTTMKNEGSSAAELLLSTFHAEHRSAYSRQCAEERRLTSRNALIRELIDLGLATIKE